jgi:hypothetical protein
MSKQKQVVQLGTEEIQSLNDLVQKFLMAKKSLLVLSLLGKEEQKFIQETMCKKVEMILFMPK